MVDSPDSNRPTSSLCVSQTSEFANLQIGEVMAMNQTVIDGA